MKRREFNVSLLAAYGAALTGMSIGVSRRRQPMQVNAERLLEHMRELSRFGENPQGGVSRVAYSQADLEGREYVMGLMRDAGLNPTIDLAGNIIGRRVGGARSLPPIMFGSHIDSVPEGGNFDGPLGSLSAIELAQTLAENDVTTRHPLEVVIFQNEEGGKIGSRSIIGEVNARELDLVSHSGKTIAEGIAYIGGDPERLEETIREPGSVAGFLELHVEQGGTLEHEAIDIGVVEGIVGIRRWNVTVTGAANHAGTTPMDIRQDALLAAARFVDAVHRVVRSIPGRQVGTVGRIEAAPGAPNVIPGLVTMSLELRDLDMEKIEDIYRRIESAAQEIGKETGTEFDLDEFYLSASAISDDRLKRVVAESAAELGLSSIPMPSGAGHDAQSIAKLGPMGMIFVPSVGGVSHSPLEYTEPQDVVNGANVLLNTVLRTDRIL
jgi:N-carbamoyl-L-amino-acid hydrolase